MKNDGFLHGILISEGREERRLLFALLQGHLID